MSYFNDAVDWLGGYPFEFAKPEEIIFFCKNKLNLELINLETDLDYYIRGSLTYKLPYNFELGSIWLIRQGSWYTPVVSSIPDEELIGDIYFPNEYGNQKSILPKKQTRVERVVS